MDRRYPRPRRVSVGRAGIGGGRFYMYQYTQIVRQVVSVYESFIFEPIDNSPIADALLVDHLIDEVAAKNEQIANLESDILGRELIALDLDEKIEDLTAKLSQSEARERLARDRASAEINKRRDLESRIRDLELDVSRERLGREAVTDKLDAKGRDLLQLAARYNELNFDDDFDLRILIPERHKE